MDTGDIIVVPFPHPGHLFPATELCLRLADRNCNVKFILPSALSSISSALTLHPLVQTIDLPISDLIRIDPSFLDTDLPNFLSDFLSHRRARSALPLCAVVDDIIGWISTTFHDFGVPSVSFFTSSAISSAVEHAISQIEPAIDPLPTTVPGLPEDVVLTAFDVAQKDHHRGYPPFGPSGKDGRSPRRRDITSTNGAVGLIMNTCVDLEGPFLEYVARVARKPVWAVGPLLPDRFFFRRVVASPVRDEEVRALREDNISEADVHSWLDSKPRGSVIYVSFGSLVRPSDGELVELAAGLEESERPFLWAVQEGGRQHGPDGRWLEGEGGFFPEGLQESVGGRGMLIRGWAPQLLILTHPATGGYLCHCGWNSTLEALCCGMPVMTWPVRGDQLHNAKLLVNLLGVGVQLRAEPGKPVSREDVARGIERLMTDDEMRNRAASVRSVFAKGLPRSSAAAFDAFLEFASSASGMKGKEGP
ncbi:hypothetical protein HPP92_027033 [Vanilla planifolia]|uniref:Glycosyltransferase n=1 Tax=Vanilla planifolia TaxID=51239 RepID=A0A835RGP1_VANPL|nr:hypothetical protein HPP92_027033 [Vanilla planifolia]KAG0488639.1 hypothetical protein HPP92_007450 [Vanilla planifolia]